MRALLAELGRQRWYAQGGTSGASTARKFSSPAVALGLLSDTVPGTNSGFVLHEVSACNDDQYGLNAATRIEAAGVSLLVCPRKRLTCFTAGAGKYAGEHAGRIFVQEVLLSHRRFAEVGVSAAKGFTKSALPWGVE